MIAAAAGTGGGILGLALSTAITSGYDNPGPIDFFCSTRRPRERPLRSLSWLNRQPAG